MLEQIHQKPISSSKNNSDSDIILQVQELTKEFTLHEQNKVLPGFQNISFNVKFGKLTALIGTSGAGKSSLLKCIYRTYLSESGEINYLTAAGTWLDLANANEYEILNLRRKEISFVTQFLHCLPRQTTLDVVAKPLFDSGCERNQALEKAAILLQKMQLPERLWKISPATFSGGEKQRVNLARGMIMNPRLLLLDEPTASLDTNTSKSVIELIQSIKKAGTAIIAVFHDPELIAILADDVVTVELN
ncbi:phosphonate C-P lyase system protein PhnL [Calothrix parasitica NIES-267]|uniref:Phosphonate C-P lyase system protein PhnL n=1 Tax=Calothrix parasitica NIES-267 TaxID=1973488 RepID=A0A1Z4LQ25_9CYAN|nr:phosphonate C-P lyase system protein PhnL [Calothrix parasitica NIES-267]